MGKVVDYWDSLIEQGLWPWIGYYHYPTNVRKYGYGGTKRDSDESDGVVAAMGEEPEIVGIQRDDVDWGQPMYITPDGPTRTLSKREWLDALAYLRVAAAAMYNQGKLEDTFMMGIGKYGAEVMSYAYP